MNRMLDYQMSLILLKDISLTNKIMKKYFEEIKQIPNLNEFQHQFNIVQRVSKQLINKKEIEK